jgi:ATP-dependent Lon protease
MAEEREIQAGGSVQGGDDAAVGGAEERREAERLESAVKAEEQEGEAVQEEGRSGGRDEMQIPTELPILPLRAAVVYPTMVIPLMVGRQKSIRLIDDAVLGTKIIGLLNQMNPEEEDPPVERLYQVGTVAAILKMVKMPDNSVRIMTHGLQRFRVVEFTQTHPYIKARIELLHDILEQDKRVEALARNVKSLFQKIVAQSPHLPDELAIMVLNIEDPGRLADMVASGANLTFEEKQELLETLDVRERLEHIDRYLTKELEILEIGNKIQSEIKSEMDKTQREYILRQQLKALQKELGEGDERTMEIEEFREKIKKAKMPKEAREAAEKELDRLAMMNPAAAEYTVSRTYLDWLVELPWSKSTRDKLDIKAAKKILDEDHYDLDKVKERILEYLAVRKLKRDIKGPILCFVGPPGVGKTSLGRSIARAMGRKFIRMSLGGVRDEAEIRGHRRTYVGALPGRIIQGIRRCGSNNPVFMLDEVDKIGMDFRGDPASALLEVLDPEQNSTFSDHYLDLDFDLSKVMFITTANLLEPIPPALLDRMEVLRLPGYTLEDKVRIAQQFLIPKQIKEHGLKKGQVRFDRKAIVTIIDAYTREAGLRNLEREIATICRKLARRVAEGDKGPFRVTARSVGKYLGPIRFFPDVAERLAVPGVAMGLAWTMFGGDVLFIESTAMRGKKSLMLTGSLGDVMKESAQTALSFIRSHSDDYGLAPDFFENLDIHVHVPEGATPKDGPSAGVTMFASLLSLLTRRRVRSDVAMTGEITLRGQVLPVGGVKEKVLAAYRAGLKRVVLPELNRKDLEDIPPEIRRRMRFHFVKRMEELADLVLEEEPVEEPAAASASGEAEASSGS